MVKSIPFGDIAIPNPGFGAMGFSHHRGPAVDEESLKTLRKAYDIGCTFWDTASIYGYGHNEELIGRFFKEGEGNGVERSKVFVASKCGFILDFENKKDLGVTNSPQHIDEYLTASTKRLGSAPDLYYLHRMDKETPLEESITALDRMKKEGRCRFIGLSEPSADTLKKACKIAHIDAIEIEYSPWFTEHETNGVVDAAKSLGVAIVAYSPLGRGVLTGKFRDAALFAGPNDNRGGIPKYSAENLPKNLRLVDELEKIAAKKGCTVGQLAIAWVGKQGAIAIPGTKKEDRLEENWKSRDVDLTDEEEQDIRRIIKEFAPVGARYDAEALKRVGA